MRVLYGLSIGCITEENYWAEYFIGLFQTVENADDARKRLMSDCGQFSKPDCKVRISEIELIGDADVIEQVYRFYGQNIDASFEGDIVESPCYIDKSTAIEEFRKAKRQTPRQQWRLETHIIGKCNW